MSDVLPPSDASDAGGSGGSSVSPPDSGDVVPGDATVELDVSGTAPLNRSLVLVIGAVLVVAALLTVGLLFRQLATPDGPAALPTAEPTLTSPSSSASAGGVVEIAIPRGVDPESLAVRVSVNPDAPVLSVWEDFQCPACGLFEAASAGVIGELVRAGNLAIEWRPVSFLDEAFGNDSSLRASAAWGCAIDQGFAPQFHDVVFANQPVPEGQGFTDGQILEFGRQAGIEGSAFDEYAECVSSGKYFSWPAASTGLFRAAGLSGTPYATLDGEPVDVRVLVDPERLRALILARS